MRIIFLFFNLLFIPSSVIAEQVQIFSVNEPPANFIDEQQVAKGFATEVIQAMQQFLMHDEKIQFIPEARALSTAQNTPNTLLFSFSRTQSREDEFHWIGKVMSKRWQVFALKNSAISIESEQQLKALPKIGVTRGDIREEWLLSQHYSNLNAVTQHQQNIKMLLNGRVSAIAYEQQGLLYYCRNNDIDCSDILPIYTLRTSDVYILMSKNKPLTEVKRWQEAYKAVKASGKLAMIMQAWQSTLQKRWQIKSEIIDDTLAF